MQNKIHFLGLTAFTSLLCAMSFVPAFSGRGEARASWIAMPLEEVVARSDLAVLGTIVRSEGTIERGGRIYEIGIIEVQEVISGEKEVGEVRLMWPTREKADGVRMFVSTDITYRVGQEGVWLLRADSDSPDLFLADRPDRLQPVEKAEEIAAMNRARTPAGEEKLTRLAESNTRFALDLYALLSEDEGNLFFSPCSISTALAMTCAGARGETAEQMAAALHFPQAPDELHAAFRALSERLEQIQREGEVGLNIANSLWPQQDYPFLEEYLDLLKEYYGTSVTPVDYARAAEAAAAINEWVEGKTEEKIKDLISPDDLDELTRLVLVNAIYFKGDWKSPFDADRTEDAPFYISREETVDVAMMQQKEHFPYMQNDTLQVLELPYAGDDISMLVLLPRERGNIAEVERLLVENPARLGEWTQNLRRREVQVHLPRFQFEWGARSLVPELEKLGMVDAFDDTAADLSGMDGTRLLYVSDVVHKAFVEVNEEGTEAAAATGVIVDMRSAFIPPVFRADHPFIFIIRENETGSILFMGRVSQPEHPGNGAAALE